tara:strand:- start:6 stop:509 length:504 start_codon:yes stop_codon:yes gene_type:complete
MKKILTTLLVAALACSPDASATNLGQAPHISTRDINNNAYNLSDHRGEVVVINFWATWCAPCIAELPVLNTMHVGYQAAGKPVSVIAISIDEARFASAVKAHVKSRGYKFTTLHDTDTEIVSRYAPSKAIPYTVIVDQEGNIVFSQLGYTPGVEDKYYTIIERLLND